MPNAGLGQQDRCLSPEGVLQVLHDNRFHLGNLWTVSEAVLRDIGLDDADARLLTRAARVHCAIMQHLVSLGGRNNRVSDGEGDLAEDHYHST